MLQLLVPTFYSSRHRIEHFRTSAALLLNLRNHIVHCALVHDSTASDWRLIMTLGTILLIILIIALLGGFSGLGGGPFYGTGYYGGGGLGLVLVIVLILVLLGKI